MIRRRSTVVAVALACAAAIVPGAAAQRGAAVTPPAQAPARTSAAPHAAATPHAGATSASGPARAKDESAVVSGTVLDGPDGKPAPHALVMIAAVDRGLIRTVATDRAGHFTLEGLPAGHYLLAAGKPTFLAAMYGAGRLAGPGAAIDLASAERMHDVTLALTRGGVVAGHVFDASGQPLANARVRVSQRREIAGEVTLTGDLGDPVGAVTDDRGAYRIFDLAPGVYAVAVQPRGNPPGPLVETASTAASAAATRTLAYAPIYFPSAADAARSEPIAIAAGDVRTDVDLHTTLVPLARVEGLVTMPPNGANGSPANVQVTLRPAGSSAGALFNVFNTRPGPDGRFAFANVPPGDYVALARLVPPAQPPTPGAPAAAAAAAQSYARAAVTVRGEPVTNVALTLAAGATLSGHVVFEGLPGLPGDIGSVRISVRPTPGSAVPVTPDAVVTDAHAAFAIAGLAPGRYRLFVQVPNNNVTQAPDWYAETALVAGADAFDVPFEVMPGQHVNDVTVRLTDDAQEIDGHVRDAAGQPVRDRTVVVFSTDRAGWFQGSRRIAVRQTDAQGAFVFGMVAGLPPGDYAIAATPTLGPNDQFDPVVLDALARTAKKVTLAANDTKTVELTTSLRGASRHGASRR